MNMPDLQSTMTTLCAELIRRGARFFTDDLLFLRRAEGGVLPQPGPPMMTLSRTAQK